MVVKVLFDGNLGGQKMLLKVQCFVAGVTNPTRFSGKWPVFGCFYAFQGVLRQSFCFLCNYGIELMLVFVKNKEIFYYADCIAKTQADSKFFKNGCL